jgi:hypothetical protein
MFPTFCSSLHLNDLHCSLMGSCEEWSTQYKRLSSPDLLKGALQGAIQSNLQPVRAIVRIFFSISSLVSLLLCAPLVPDGAVFRSPFSPPVDSRVSARLLLDKSFFFL